VGRLVHAHRGRLLALARGEGLGAEDAFDVVQEAFGTFLSMPAAQGLVDVPEDSRKLLMAITRNLARNRRRLAATAWPHHRDPTVLEALPAETRGVDELLSAAEEELRLRGCVETLGDLQKAVVTLRMLDEADGVDVARTLGITTNSVAVLLHRAKANLHACMTARD
jgi:RNA polymerase sigma-70 factor, ECF subfamily